MPNNEISIGFIISLSDLMTQPFITEQGNEEKHFNEWQATPNQ